MNCVYCKDSGYTKRGAPCPVCCEGLPLIALDQAAKRQVRQAALGDLPLTPVELIVAELIVKHTIKNPIKISEICATTHLSDRQVKEIVRSLRAVHLLPIASSRGIREDKESGRAAIPPGYYWAHSREEWEPYYAQFRGQALDELRTIYRVTKARFPGNEDDLKFNFFS